MFDAVVPHNSDTNVTLTAVASFLRTTWYTKLTGNQSSESWNYVEVLWFLYCILVFLIQGTRLYVSMIYKLLKMHEILGLWIHVFL